MWSLPSRPLTAIALIGALLTFSTSQLSGSTAQSGASNSIQQGVPVPSIHTPPGVNLVTNGDFANGLDRWIPFATPDLDHIVLQEADGALQFYKVPVPSGQWHNQAVVYQNTQTALLPASPIASSFDLGNSSDVRKRISVLIHENDFSDLHVCTFWLAPHSPLRRYSMRTHTSRFWWNTTISFYAASGGSLGGFYDVDNVSLTYEPTANYTDRTLCDDPTAPAPIAGAPDGPNLLQNGDFSSGLAPWAVLFNLTNQVSNGVFEFTWTQDATQSIIPPFPSFDPAPVVIQRTQQPIAAGEILTAQVDLGNSSDVRKRVSILIHQWDFDDLAACTFWLDPGTPLQTYTMRMYATEAWTDASFSVYAATRGPDRWIQMDNASLKRTPGANIGGKECYEAGSFNPNPAMASAPGAGALKAPASSRAAGAFSGLANRGDVSSAAAAAPAPVSSSLLGRLSAERLRVRVPPGDETREIQVSTDNETWTTLVVAPPSEDWQVYTLDLRGLRGRLSLRIQ